MLGARRPGITVRGRAIVALPRSWQLGPMQLWLVDLAPVTQHGGGVRAPTGSPATRSGMDDVTRADPAARVAARRAWGEALRRVAAGTLAGVPPAAVRAGRSEAGAPFVTIEGRTEGAPHVSISHSGSVLACAVDLEPVGVDIEWHGRARDVTRLAAFALTDAERAWFAAQHDPAHAFHQLWTGKEAILKLAGPRGFEGGVLDVRFDVRDGVLVPPPLAGSVAFWHPQPDVACTIASARPAARALPATLQQLSPHDLLARLAA